MSSSQLSIHPAPLDCVSRVSFSPTSTRLLCSTWAGTLSVHDVQTASLQVDVNKHSAALLDACWTSDNALLAASLDGSVLTTTLSNTLAPQWSVLGTHSAAVRCVTALRTDLLVSASWDSRLKIWTPDAEKPLHDLDAGGKVFGLTSVRDHSVALINSKREVRLIDTRKPSEPVYQKVPPKLNHQLRGLSVHPDGRQFVVGSTAGHAAVDSFDSSVNSFSFKCHRVDGLAFPVNCITHNLKYGSFATGGGDGHVSFWDGNARKRIAQFARFPTSVAAIDFDSESTNIAIAVSYTFEEGEKDHPPDEVHIRKLEDGHIATKAGILTKQPQ